LLLILVGKAIIMDLLDSTSMTSNQVVFKARQTILEMFRDRKYQGRYDQAAELTASKFYEDTIVKGQPNFNIDLWGFTDTRTIFVKTVNKKDNTEVEEEKEIKVPVYVHFSADDRPRSSGKDSRLDLYKGILTGPENDPEKAQYKGWLRECHDDTFPPNMKLAYDPKNPDGWKVTIMNEEILLGFHLIVVYNGWNHAQNKTRQDLFQMHASGPRDRYIYDMEVIPSFSMVKNITKHELVPKHTLLTTEEKTSFLAKQADYYLNDQDRAKYEGLSAQQQFQFMESYMFEILPKIQLNDPINMWYYGRLKQIYLIVRNGQSVTYRIVKKSPLLQDQQK